MGDLELRNNELFNEITWLKQQMGNFPMVRIRYFFCYSFSFKKREDRGGRVCC